MNPRPAVPQPVPQQPSMQGSIPEPVRGVVGTAQVAPETADRPERLPHPQSAPTGCHPAPKVRIPTFGTVDRVDGAPCV